MVKQVDWTDDNGCLRRSLLPDYALDAEAPAGIPVGADIRFYRSEREIACALQNELRRRGLWGQADVKRLRGRASTEVFAALQAVLRVDAQSVLDQYRLAEGN